MTTPSNRNWPQVALGEVCEKTETVDPRKSPETLFRYVDVSSVSNETFTIVQTQHLLGNEAPSRARRKLAKGDILFATIRPTLQRIAQVPEELDGEVCSTGFVVLRPKPNLDSTFLKYSLFRPEFMAEMERLQSGASYPAVTDKQVRERSIPLPPLEEQRRIVEVLDKAFERLARARTNAEINLQNSREIANRALDVLIADLVERNGRIQLSEIAAVKGGKRLPKGEKTSTSKTPFPYITVRDFTDDGTVSTEKLGYISEKIQTSIARYTVSSQDVYVSIAGTIGKSGIVPNELDGANLTENAAKLVLEDGWSKEYVYWCTRSSDFTAQTDEQTRVAAQPKLALQRLGAITVPKASNAEQVKLCDKMASLRSTRSDLVVAYDQKLQDLDDLRQSLLQKAFAGELT